MAREAHRQVVASFFLNILVLVLFAEVGYANSYFIANDGDDRAEGNTAATAWKSLSKVNSQTFAPGDSILFKAGHSWRGELSISKSGTVEKWIYYGRYGEGRNPQFLGSEVAKGWSPSGVNHIWQASGTFDNYGADSYAGNVFFCNSDSVHWGEYRHYSANFSALASRYDWTINNQILYIYCDVDPNSAYDSVEVTQRERVVALTNENENPTNYIEWEGIDIHFSKRQGFLPDIPRFGALMA